MYVCVRVLIYKHRYNETSETLIVKKSLLHESYMYRYFPL